MSNNNVEALLDDIRLLGETRYSLVQGVRRLVKELVPNAAETVKYGGVLFAANEPFCGVFAYKEHVSVEFSCGAKISDSLGHLEGKGKGRRHVKLFEVDDIDAKALAFYIPLALEAARVTK